jgi:hypothetical protein
MQLRKTRLAIALLGSTLAVPALAATDVSVSYLSKKYDLGDLQAAVNGPDSPQGATSGDITAKGGKLNVAVDFPALGFGSKPALVFSAFYVNGDEEHVETSQGIGLGFIPVDGSSAANGSTGAYDIGYRTELKHYGLDALLRTGLLDTDLQELTVSGGLTYSKMKQERIFVGIQNGATIPDSLGLLDELETDYYGIALGADYRFKLGSGFSLVAGTRVDLLSSSSSLDASQVINTVPYTQSADDSGFVTRLEAKAGVSYRYSNFSAGLLATVESLDIPKIDHALYNNNIYPTRLSDDSSTITGFELSVGMSF